MLQNLMVRGINFIIKNRIKIIIAAFFVAAVHFALFSINQQHRIKFLQENIDTLKEEIETERAKHRNEVAGLNKQITMGKLGGVFFPETAENIEYLGPRRDLYYYLLENAKDSKVKEDIILGGFYYYRAFFYDIDCDNVDEIIGMPKYKGYNSSHLYILKKAGDKYVDISSVDMPSCVFVRFSDHYDKEIKFKTIACADASGDKKYILYKRDKKRYE